MPGHDFSTGEVLTAANTDAYLNNSFYAQMRQTVSQNFLDSTFAAITFTVEDWDTDSGHDNSTNTSRYTAQTAGRYLFMGGHGLAGSVTGQRYAVWFKNGAAVNGGGARVPGSANASLTVARPLTIDLAVGDYVELHGHQNSGGTLASLVVGDTQSTMTVWRMSS